MKNILIIEPKIDTPKILFDAKKGELRIEGKSFPPDVTSTFKEVLQWIDYQK